MSLHVCLKLWIKTESVIEGKALLGGKVHLREISEGARRVRFEVVRVELGLIQ